MSEDKKNENIKATGHDDFNEKEEIEKLQEKIKKMSDSEQTDEQNEQHQAEFEQEQVEEQPDTSIIDYDSYPIEEENDEDENQPKKFIVSVEPKSVKYFDNLSVDERSKLFNELLSNYIENEDKINANKRKKRIIMHIIVAIVTLIFAVPAAFYVVNKAIHLTVLNYKGAQANFEKLYESRGIILEHQRMHKNQ